MLALETEPTPTTSATIPSRGERRPEESSLTNTSEPVIDWSTAPDQLRAAFERTQQQLQEAQASGSELEDLRRQNAMLMAGVDMTHPTAPYFMKGYDGELKVDDIKAEWEKIAGTQASTQGANPPGQPPATPPAPPANEDGSDPTVVAQLQDLQHQRQQLGTGGVAPGEEPSPDPQDKMLADYHVNRARGLNRNQSAALAIDGLIGAAVAGDPRVVSDSAVSATEKWRAKNFPEYG